MINKEQAFLIDVDGTIAEADGLRGIYEYDKVNLDLPKRTVISVVKSLASDWQPIFITGRPDSGTCRQDTVRWIRTHVDPYGYMPAWPLFMRPEFLPGKDKRDFRKDFEVKEELFRKYIDPRWDVQFAIDDRLQVCQMWHKIGIPVFRVGDPDATY